MEALISHLGIRISHIPSISSALQRPRALRLPFDNPVALVAVSYPGQSLGKTSLASEVVLQKMGDGKKGFECRNSVWEAETSVDSNGGQFLKSSIRRKRLAVFVSGGGSNFQTIHKATLGGSVLGDVVVLVTDKPGCGGAEYARNNDIPVILFPETKCSPEGLSALDLVTSLRSFKVDFILLAGYLKLIPAELVQEYPKAMLNIHPSLLPAFGGRGFYGLKVHKAVIASGARCRGCCRDHFWLQALTWGCNVDLVLGLGFIKKAIIFILLVIFGLGSLQKAIIFVLLEVLIVVSTIAIELVMLHGKALD